MRRRLRTGWLVAGFVVLILGAFSVQAATPQAAGQTLNLNFPNSQPRAVADVAPKGPSVGDTFYFKGGVTDESATSVGHLFADASAFTKDGNRVQITATITLDQGALNAIGELNFNSQDQGTLSIVGGTGDFDGARGSAVITADQTTNNINIDITLLP
jgi:hypothetical protein